MDTLQYIVDKFKIDLSQKRMPIEIWNYGRVQMAALFHELGFKVGVEIGVEQGLYSEALCKYNPGVKLFSVDPWKAYRGYRDHVNQQKIDGFYESAKQRLAPYDCTLVKKFSLDAVKDFKDGSLDFVYIDGNHNFYNATADIWFWTPKVRMGGIISGHDFVVHRRPTGMHVVEVVYGYTSAYEIRPWFVLGSKAMEDGIIRDEARSFMWVNAPFKSPRRNQQ